MRIVTYEMVRLYSKLTGKDGLNVPVGIIGAYLDGYEKGKVDAQPVIVPCNYVRACNEATMYKLTSAVLYLEVLEELKKHGYVLVDMRETKKI